MTTATPTLATIKFTGLSPVTTEILRRSTTLQQKAGTAKIGRTIATFEMSVDELKLLLDHLIEREITGSGASSPEVKRLRGLRREFSEALAGAQHTCCKITQHEESDPLRDQILDALADFCWDAVPQGGAETAWATLDTLADMRTWQSPAHIRAWLAEHL